MIRTYSEMIQYETFEERLEYLRLGGGVARPTFGSDRWINQDFYHSVEWRSARDYVIDRDRGCDLGVPGYFIHAELTIHHINPMTPEDIIDGLEWIVDPEYLVTTCERTHRDIHYARRRLVPGVVLERSPNDTKLW
jgi:hypothetical protein